MRAMLNRFAIVLACLLCLGTPANTAAAEDPVTLCRSMGLLDPHAGCWHGDHAMPRDLWARVLGEALGSAAATASPVPSATDRLGRPVRASWHAVRPPPPVTHTEVLLSLAAAAHVPPASDDRVVKGPRAGSSAGVSARGNLPTVRWSLAELLVQLRSPRLACVSDPITAVRGYYGTLTKVVGGPAAALSDLAEWCCGEALVRLRRNLAALGSDAAFRLVSLQTGDVLTTGWLAEVNVTRAADQQLGAVVSRTTVSDRFYLRYDGVGWKIYR